ncbi:MAG: PAS domain-containing protein, partial [Syntrophaceae bacterium]
DLFSPLDRKWRIYEKKEGALLPNIIRDYAVPLFTPKMRLGAAAAASKDLESSIPELMRSVILDNFAPPAVLVNRKGDILYISGRTGKYLEPASGKANLNILVMAREDLRFEIGSAIHKAAAQKTSVTTKDIRVRVNGGEQHINVTVKPLETGKENELLMVVFEDIKPPETAIKGGKDKSRANVLVERELQRTKERLSATIEEMQVSQEEYRAANEELESTNEELQSTNEELISSKEEMQSLNEELLSVNAELQEKVNALLEAENDMKNLLNSTEIATLFLDNDLKVRRFTPEAAKIIKLIKGDVGRPITDIVSNLKYDRLGEDTGEVLEKLATKEMEVESKDGNWYLMRILPYRTVENVIQGVVITFTGITALKRLEMAIMEEHQYAESILETVREPLVVLDGRLRVVSANRSFYRTFHVSPDETQNKLIFSLGNRQWDIPELRELLEKIIPEKREFDNFRVEHMSPKTGRKLMLLNARKIEQKANGKDLILLAIEDVPKEGKPENSPI